MRFHIANAAKTPLMVSDTQVSDLLFFHRLSDAK
jgi:hypothetical protein